MKAYATKMAKSQEIERKWYVVDATDMVLGRLATEVATVLRGKNKPYFTPTSTAATLSLLSMRTRFA